MKYRKLDLNEMMEYVNGIIGTTENKFCNDCIYKNKKEESYYIELCIEKYISFFNKRSKESLS